MIPIHRFMHYIADGLPVLAGQLSDSTLTGEGLLRPEINLFWSTVKVALALGITLVLLVATVWILKRVMDTRRLPGMSAGSIEPIEIRYLAPRRSIALVRVGSRVLIVGITENGMSNLGELTSEEIAALDTGAKDQGGFVSLLDGFRRKT